MEETKDNNLRKEFQDFADASMWQGENEYTKNFGIGTVADWWLNKVDQALLEQIEEIKKGVEDYKVPKEWKANKVGSDYIFVYDLYHFVLSQIKK
jgi:hypothetical protein